MYEKFELWDIKLPLADIEGLKRHADEMKALSGIKTDSSKIFRPILRAVYEHPEKLAGVVTQLIKEPISGNPEPDQAPNRYSPFRVPLTHRNWIESVARSCNWSNSQLASLLIRTFLDGRLSLADPDEPEAPKEPEDQPKTCNPPPAEVE